jgi:hypothetical protein
MSHTELLLPVINSSAPEHLLAVKDTMERGEIPEDTIRLRVGVGLSLDYARLEDGPLLGHPSWERGLERLYDRKVAAAVFSLRAADQLHMSPNRGLRLEVTPTSLSSERVYLDRHPSEYTEELLKRVEDAPEVYKGLEIDAPHKVHNTVWSLAGSTVVDNTLLAIRARFKAGKGGGIARLLTTSERQAAQLR